MPGMLRGVQSGRWSVRRSVAAERCGCAERMRVVLPERRGEGAEDRQAVRWERGRVGGKQGEAIERE